MVSSDGDSRPELWLSDDEVRALTNKKQAKAQCRVLDEAGYDYKIVNKRPIVYRHNFRQNTLPPAPRLRLV